MGLFGGFKAKFTKDSQAKSSKSVQKDEVVCLGYRVYSEFDSPPQYLQKPPETTKQLPAIRTVSSRPNSTPKSGEFSAVQPSTSTHTETQIVINPKVKKSSKKKAPQTDKHALMVSATSASNISEEVSSTGSLNRETSVSNPNLASATTETVILRNGSVKSESRSAPNSVYVRGKTSSFNPYSSETSSTQSTGYSAEVVAQDVSPKPPPKSILKHKSSVYIEDVNSGVSKTASDRDNNTILTSQENIYSEAEYDRSMTLASSKSSKIGAKTTKTADYMTASQSVSKNSTREVPTHMHTEVSSSKNNASAIYNETSSSSHYSGGYASYSTSTIGSTSNHAASIFFGGDEEPEVQRPRRANLAVVQSEEERRSSAEC